MAAPEARQAAATDGPFVYVVTNESVAKYDRSSGKRLGVSHGGNARHMNSAVFHQGKLYCAESNYPATPERSRIMVLDPNTMTLATFHDFGDSRGSLTWCVYERGSWWCNFAQYGKHNDETVLVKFDDEWRRQSEWTYPKAVVSKLGRMSISGGVWLDGLLLVTGHDRREIFRLKLPRKGHELDLVDTAAAPFPGQGIALDPTNGGLVGIDRSKRLVVFAEEK